MKTIIHGPVTNRDLDDAGLMAGIYPTALITNGMRPLHKSLDHLPHEAHPVCMMQPEETREKARNYTLAQAGEALICKGRNEHLVSLARQYGLPVYEV